MLPLLASLLLSLYFVDAQVGVIPELPAEIVLPLTYRDFLPSSCAYSSPEVPFGFAGRFNNIEVVETAWGIVVSEPPNPIEPERPQICQIYGSEGRDGREVSEKIFQDALISQTIKSHPDFEVRDYTIEKKGECTSPFPVKSCAFNLVDGEFQIQLNLSIVQQELEIGNNGLGRLVYCGSGDGDETECGVVIEGGEFAGVSQTRKEFFDLWYSDDLAFNKRIGQNLVLKGDPDNEGSFVFDSEIDIDDPDTDTDFVIGHFGPLGRFSLGEDSFVTEFDVVEGFDLLDAPVWPRTILDPLPGTSELKSNNKTYYFTSELHTTFEYRSNASMLFTFAGDDDFWAFVNNKLVIDLGGVHRPQTATINLNNETLIIEGQTLQEYLGLIDGEIATLDIFHAERQTSESNFAITTTLFPACNVLLSGTEALQAIGVNFIDTLKLGNNVEFIEEENEILLQQIGRPFSSGFFFTEQQQNVGRGFQAKFDVKVSSITEGFAFVVQAEGVTDFPVLSGSTFGIQGLKNSFAVVFDFCANREEINDFSECNLQRVSVQHADSPDEGNSFSDETRRTFDFIARRLTRDEYFPVEIVHFGGSPNFLEVYVNQSLYLREVDFDVEAVLGNVGGHVGITATSSEVSADIRIKDFSIKTVEVNPISSEILSDDIFEVELLVADGQNATEGILFSTSDACANNLEAGTLEGLFDVKFIQIPDEESSDDNSDEQEQNDSPSRKLQDEGLNVEDGFIQDNGDGTYNIQLITETPGLYRVVIAFGASCSLVEVDGDFQLVPPEGLSEDACFFEPNFNNGEPVALAEPPEEDDIDVDGNEQEVEENIPLAVIGSVSGCCFIFLLVILSLYLAKRRKWDEEKVYVPAGELFKTEMETKFDPQNEYNETGKAVLNTQKEILELQTHQSLNDRNREIVGLRTENEELKEVLRVNKRGVVTHQHTESARKSYEEDINIQASGSKKVRRTEF